MKRILILAGSAFQVPLIERAKRDGHYVITCDYLPENPGHKISDEYHNVSTTDKEGVLRLARERQIDAVTTISSDPAVPTVAHVADALGLPGPTIDSVAFLTQKDLFRALLHSTGLNVPKSYVVTSDTVPGELRQSEASYVVKPVDSSGSKGITFCAAGGVDMRAAIRLALEYSRSGRCIIEQYIDGPQLHGDGYVENGELIYSYLGDHVFYTRTNNFIPVSTRWPSSASPRVLEEIKRQVSSIVKAAGYNRGPVNIEARVARDERVFIIEVGPRNGGNFVPIIQHTLTGFDFLDRILADSLALPLSNAKANGQYRVGAHYILHGDRTGRFVGVSISEEAQGHVFFESIFKQHGNGVERFTGSNTTVGVLLLQFDSVRQRNALMAEAESHFRLILG